MPESPHHPDPALSTDTPIVLLSSACWEVDTPVNVHHIARRFAALGHRVLFVESTGLRGPSSRSLHDRSRVLRRLRGWWRGAREVDENLLVLSPLAIPAGWPKPARQINTRWLSAAVRAAMKRHHISNPVLWAFLPVYHPLADRIPNRLLVYHCVDDYAANPGVDGAAIRDAEQRMLERAELVIATSRPLADRLAQQRDDVHLLPNVADVERFAKAVEAELSEPEDLAAIPRPRAVYIGNLATYRFDFALLDTVAARRPEVNFVLIGPLGLGDVDASDATRRVLSERPNIHLLGPRSHDALPTYLAHCDVGIIPFLDNGHTRSSFPLKLWEMLAAGLPVVSSDLPALRDVAPSEMLCLAKDDDSFVEALELAIARSRHGRAQRLEVARQYDWSPRTEELRALLGSKVVRAHSTH